MLACLELPKTTRVRSWRATESRNCWGGFLILRHQHSEPKPKFRYVPKVLVSQLFSKCTGSSSADGQEKLRTLFAFLSSQLFCLCTKFTPKIFAKRYRSISPTLAVIKHFFTLFSTWIIFFPTKFYDSKFGLNIYPRAPPDESSKLKESCLSTSSSFDIVYLFINLKNSK